MLRRLGAAGNMRGCQLRCRRHVGSALLLDEWLGMSKPFFDLVCSGVELCFYGGKIVGRVDGKGHL